MSVVGFLHWTKISVVNDLKEEKSVLAQRFGSMVGWLHCSRTEVKQNIIVEGYGGGKLLNA